MPRKVGNGGIKPDSTPSRTATETHDSFPANASHGPRKSGGESGGVMDCIAQPGVRAQARCRAILESAQKLFVENGYDQTSLNDILQVSGGSRATLYEHFGDKKGLLRAVLARHCDQIFEETTRILDISPGISPQEWLTRLGLRLAGILCSEDGAAFLQILASKGQHVPDVVATFMEAGPEKTRGLLISYFREKNASGELNIPHPETAARAFSGMIVAPFLLRRLILPHEKIDEKELTAYVHQAVRQFMAGARLNTEGA